MWYAQPGEIQVTKAPAGVTYVLEPTDVKRLQDAENARAAEARTEALAWNLTPRQMYEDAQDAFVGILGDLMGQSERTSVKDIVTHGNRLRGLGILLVALALVGLIVRSMLAAPDT